MVSRLICIQKVPSSIPGGSTFLKLVVVSMSAMLVGCLFYTAGFASSIIEKRKVSFEEPCGGFVMPALKRSTSPSCASVEQKYDVAIRQILEDEPTFLDELQAKLNLQHTDHVIDHVWQWNQAEFAAVLRSSGAGPYDESTISACQDVIARYFVDLESKPLAQMLPRLLRENVNYKEFFAASQTYTLQVEDGESNQGYSKVDITPDQLLLYITSPKGHTFIERSTGASITIQGTLAAALIPSRRIFIFAELNRQSTGTVVVNIKLCRAGSAATETIYQTEAVISLTSVPGPTVTLKVNDKSDSCMVMIDWPCYQGPKYLQFSVNADGTFPVPVTATEWRVDDYVYPKESHQLINWLGDHHLSLVSTKDAFVLAKLKFCAEELVPDSWAGEHNRQRLLRALLAQVKQESVMSETTRKLVHLFLVGRPYRDQSIPRLVMDTIKGHNLGIDCPIPELDAILSDKWASAVEVAEAEVVPVQAQPLEPVERVELVEPVVDTGRAKRLLESIRCNVS